MLLRGTVPVGRWKAWGMTAAVIPYSEAEAMEADSQADSLELTVRTSAGYDRYSPFVSPELLAGHQLLG